MPPATCKKQLHVSNNTAKTGRGRRCAPPTARCRVISEKRSLALSQAVHRLWRWEAAWLPIRFPGIWARLRSVMSRAAETRRVWQSVLPAMCLRLINESPCSARPLVAENLLLGQFALADSLRGKSSTTAALGVPLKTPVLEKETNYASSLRPLGWRSVHTVLLLTWSMYTSRYWMRP